MIVTKRLSKRFVVLLIPTVTDGWFRRFLRSQFGWKWQRNQCFTQEKLEKLYTKKSSLEIEIRDSIREEARKKEKDAIEKIKCNPRAFYAYAKKKSKTLTSIGPLLDENNKLQSDPTIMSNILQGQYFTNW